MDKKWQFLCFIFFLTNLSFVTEIIFSQESASIPSLDTASTSASMPTTSILVPSELSRFFEDLHKKLLSKDPLSNETGLEKVKELVSNIRESIKSRLRNIQDEELENRSGLKDDLYKSLEESLESPKSLEKFLKKISTSKSDFTDNDCIYLKQLNLLLHESSSVLNKTFLSGGQKILHSFYDQLGCIGKIDDILEW